MRAKVYCWGLLFLFIGSCDRNPSVRKNAALAVAADSCSANFSVDTIRFTDPLTECQRRQVFYRRCFEEDYQQIDDTTRVAIRVIWWGAFRGLTILRLENRLTIVLSDAIQERKLHEKWFIMYKRDFEVLNNDYTVTKGNTYSGKIPPFVFKQSVQLLPDNKIPSVVKTLDSIGFWQMKRKYPAPPHTDGSSWTLQVYRNGRYHEVTTDLDEHPIKAIGIQLLQLTDHPDEMMAE